VAAILALLDDRALNREDLGELFLKPGQMFRAGRVKPHCESPIQIAWVIPLDWPMHVMRDRTIPVEQAADEIQKEVSRYLDSAKRQALTLSETRF
jgi:hypothetical protein